MNDTIRKYEVNLMAVNRNSHEKKEFTRLEHAYNVMDAAAQTIMNLGMEFGSSSWELTVLRIGPPVEDILKQNAK